MHGQEGLNKMRFSNNGAEFEPIRVSKVCLKKLLLNLILYVSTPHTLKQFVGNRRQVFRVCLTTLWGWCLKA